MSYLPVPNSSFDGRSGPTGRTSSQPGVVMDWSASTFSSQGQFVHYWQVIRANLGRICLFAILGMGVGRLIAVFQPPLYQARTVLDIRSLNENFLNPRENSAAGTTESVLPEAYIQTEIKILQSDSIRKRALQSLPVPAMAAVQNSDVPFWQTPLEWLQSRAVPYSALIADAGKRIKVRAVGNTRIVDVLCDARDGQLAASVCNTLARTYITNNLESREHSMKETSDWLQSQLDDVRKRLTKAENDLKDAAKVTDVGVTTEMGGNPGLDRLRELQAELSRSQTERIIKESNYLVAANRDANNLPLDMDTGPIREYRLKLADLKRQLNESKAVMTPEHYQVRELTMQVEELEKAVQNERNGLVERLKGDLEAALSREGMMSAAYEKEAERVSQRDDQAVRYSMVKHEVDSERQLYETLLQKVGEVGLAAALRTSTISIVDPAVAPLLPYSPNVMASLGGGFFGGALLAVAIALIRTRSDRTLRSPGETTMHLQLRELGVIPSIRGRGLRLLLGARRNSVSAPRGALVPTPGIREVLLGRMPQQSVALATWLRIPELAEAFIGIMNSLLLPGQGANQTRVIVMTSPERGDGKTTVSINLAIALALIGRRVVLVDGDLRKPHLRKVFHGAGDIGLSKLLEGETEIHKQPLSELVSETQIPNLSVVTTKPVEDGIAGKLHSARMRELLNRLRAEFDTVVIDSPPMLHISDARVLGWLADGVVLVFRAGNTTIESAHAVRERLAQDEVPILGVVLNEWTAQKSDPYNGYSSYFRVA